MMICPKCRSSEVEVHLEGWLYDHVNSKGKNCPGSGAYAIESKDLKTRVYIAGPMSGYPKFNYPAFNEAERRLREAGYEPVNPALPYQINEDGSDFAEGVTYRECISVAIHLLLACDGVALLPGWELSKGAQLEHHVATVLGFDVRLDEYWTDGELHD